MSGRVVLTGGSGLIGRRIVGLWRTSERTLVAPRSSQIDLLSRCGPAQLIEELAPTHLVHLAWSASGDSDYRTSTRNAQWVEATLRLVEACRDAGVRTWLTGTVVDDQPPGSGESYSRSKSDLRRAVSADVEAGALGWLRPSYVFDEEVSRPALVAQASACARSGEVLRLRTPSAAHDFIHAEDVATAVVRAVADDVTGWLPIGAGRVRRVTSLVAALGARWQAPNDEPQDVTHAEHPSDVSWLLERGWTPARTDRFFGDG